MAHKKWRGLARHFIDHVFSTCSAFALIFMTSPTSVNVKTLSNNFGLVTYKFNFLSFYFVGAQNLDIKLQFG